jgi:hypothetical protein
MKLLKRAGMGIATLLGLALIYLWLAGTGSFGAFDSDDAEPKAVARTRTSVADAEGRQRGAAPPEAKQILFGDLHVHTTISFDAFMLNLPIIGGQGAHTPADACDFARHCAALDFWSINDHAANIHPDDWRNTIESVRACNARAGSETDPDLVSFLGWEWTQAGLTPETHYGHKNVILPGLAEGEVPTRPIAASLGGTAAQPPNVLARGMMTLGGGRFHDLARRWTAIDGLPECGAGDVRDLPTECREVAPTPIELFRKLDEWNLPALVIPHGTAWGIYTPPTSSWDKQLVGAMHDPARQTLIEVYSGHGDSEAYRDWRALSFGPDGRPVCPPERADYLPMCRRAGQIIEQRCLAAGEDEASCAGHAEEARQNAMRAGISPHATVAGASSEDWLDAGQCRGCEQPAFKFRPASSAQYIAALSAFDAMGKPMRRFRMGFIASSDIHSGRAGSGYKEVDRPAMTDAGQEHPTEGAAASFFLGPPEPPEDRSRTIEAARKKLTGLQLFEAERSQSFLYTGGLVAAHATGRDRASVWSALERREVYGTSGPRLLLWFDLLDPQTQEVSIAMGGEIETDVAPTFRVRAVGSFVQKPGCPDQAISALGVDRTQQLCAGECYFPGDARHPITHVEVVRIQPQATPGEDVANLISDPWRRFACPADPAGCQVSFTDPDFAAGGRDALYYARAYEAPRPTINGGSLRCDYDAEGRCIESHPCAPGDNCLSDYAARAWSSPIYVDHRSTRR